MTTVYLIGSLRNPDIPTVGNALRAAGYDTFCDWHAGGKDADDEWRRYEQERGRSYKEALRAYNAQHIFNYDLLHLNRSHVGVLVHPAGRSAHLELGYLIGKGKLGYVLFNEEPNRWDVMNAFATDVCYSVEELLTLLDAALAPKTTWIVCDKYGSKEYRNAPWNSDL